MAWCTDCVSLKYKLKTLEKWYLLSNRSTSICSNLSKTRHNQHPVRAQTHLKIFKFFLKYFVIKVFSNTEIFKYKCEKVFNIQITFVLKLLF